MAEKPPYIDEALAHSQDEMVRVFAKCTNADDLLAGIEASEIQDELKTWLLSCRPEMLETAASLVTKWGSVDPKDGVGL